MRTELLKPGDKFDVGRSAGLLTAKGQIVIKNLREFIEYFQKAKRKDPEVLRIRWT